MNNLLITNDGICNRCGDNVLVDSKNGKIICTNCGLIKEDRFIDLTSEYRYFSENTSPQNDPRRVGNVVNTHLQSQLDLIEIDPGKRVFIRLVSYFCNSKQSG